jgi:rRNA maturation RNase YbeY
MVGVSPTADDRQPTAETITVHQANPSRTLDEDALRAVLALVADGEGFVIHELSIVLANHTTVHELNREWLGHDYETDVVSFPFDEAALINQRIDGEIYVDLDTAAERASDFDASFEEEALRYVIHGLLHLMGHDDATEEQSTAMRELEDRYLRATNG